MATFTDTPDWSRFPVPGDDGGAEHLGGMRVPSVLLLGTEGGVVDVGGVAGVMVVYVYPRTGVPGEGNLEGWDGIAGARGCTPQSCGFRDHWGELKAAGVEAVYGVSTQSTAYQREAAGRLHLPFALLSDEGMELARAMRLPTFEVGGMVLLKRLTMVVRDGWVEKVFYPVFPPDRNAGEVLRWLAGREGAG